MDKYILTCVCMETTDARSGIRKRKELWSGVCLSLSVNIA